MRPAEAADLANLIFDHAEGKPLSDDVRNRLAARAAVLKFQTFSRFLGSLERDPVHHSAYYLAVDADRNGMLPQSRGCSTSRRPPRPPAPLCQAPAHRPHAPSQRV